MLRNMIAAAVMAASCSVGALSATPAAQAAPIPSQSLFLHLDIAKTRNLDACQMKQYGSCMQKFGDHGFCYASAESYECPPE